MKKTVAVLAITIAGLFSGGAALALTGGSTPHDEPPAATESSTTNGSTQSTESESASSETESESPDTESSETESESSETESSESESDTDDSESSGQVKPNKPDKPDKLDPGRKAKHEHPRNHGADVSKAAHECPKGPEHGQCVSAVAHKHG